MHKCGTGVVAVRELWEVKLPGIGDSLGWRWGRRVSRVALEIPGKYSSCSWVSQGEWVG